MHFNLQYLIRFSWFNEIFMIFLIRFACSSPLYFKIKILLLPVLSCPVWAGRRPFWQRAADWVSHNRAVGTAKTRLAPPPHTQSGPGGGLDDGVLGGRDEGREVRAGGGDGAGGWGAGSARQEVHLSRHRGGGGHRQDPASDSLAGRLGEDDDVLIKCFCV